MPNRTTQSPSAARAPKEQPEPAEASPLARLRLLAALDALLVEQSVGRAAERMGIGAPAMSRLLKQIRSLYGDPILRKTGRGMAPTAFAERLRLRLRALSEEAEDLLQPDVATHREEIGASNRLPLTNAPALSLAPLIDIGGPTPRQFAAKLEAIGPRALPQQRLARAIATIGAGIGRSRPLSAHEAEEAFGLILAGQADPIQIGSFLSILQFRDTTAPELAGMVRALRAHIGVPAQGAGAQLDWPAYLSPKVPLRPWFLMAAKLVSHAGIGVLVHGTGGGAASGTGSERLENAAAFLGIEVAEGIGEARAAIGRGGIAFLPFEGLSDQLTALISLYRLFEMRSPVNQIVHLANPLDADALMVGAIRTTDRNLVPETAGLLGWRNLLVTAVNRDVAEATPSRQSILLRLRDGEPGEFPLPASRLQPAGRLAELSSYEYWQAVWLGQVRDEEPVRKVIDTAALALMNVRKAEPAAWPDLQAQAKLLWRKRA